MELVYNDETILVHVNLLDIACDFFKENLATEQSIAELKEELEKEWTVMCACAGISDSFSDNKFNYYVEMGFMMAFGNNIN